jgi:hypothetical protein
MNGGTSRVVNVVRERAMTSSVASTVPGSARAITRAATFIASPLIE